MADDKGAIETEQKDSSTATANGKKKRRGIFSRIWRGIFRLRGDDFEKRLQYISKEEAAVLSRMKRRSLTWRRLIRNLIIFSVILEVIAVGYAIITTRSMDMNWQMRAFRILPMFLLPAISSAAYSAFVSFMRMCDRRDQKTLERLRAERQAKIDELKEKTNYYTTQQLIQRYDPDPAAKAAAATILASKLGADSGLKVLVGHEQQLDASMGKSSDIELVQSSGLRNRKKVQSQSSSTVGAPPYSNQKLHGGVENDENAVSKYEQLVVNHHQPQDPNPHDGGWLARISAFLVGEDPTQSYALICGNCHMHNGLARKEDFPYITYYCPHCNALNKPKQSEDHVPGSNTPAIESIRKGGIGEAAPVIASLPQNDSIVSGGSSVHEIVEGKDMENRTS